MESCFLNAYFGTRQKYMMEFFEQKQLTSISCESFLWKSSITDVWEGPKYTCVEYQSSFLSKLTNVDHVSELYTARKVSKYGVFSGPYFFVFGLYTGK